MKMSVKKGHLMSEKELKEVVGGKPLEFETVDGVTLMCDGCYNEVKGPFVYDRETKIYSCFCSVCGSKVSANRMNDSSLI